MQPRASSGKQTNNQLVTASIKSRLSRERHREFIAVGLDKLLITKKIKTMTTMTTKEMFDLSGEIYDRLNDYRHDIASAIIVCMNERGYKEIDLRKTREDCEKKGFPDVAKRLEDIANKNIVDIYNKDGETLECYIDRVIIGDLGFVGCVCSGVQVPSFEITENVRTLNIQAAISVMELVAEYFYFMDEIASKK